MVVERNITDTKKRLVKIIRSFTVQFTFAYRVADPGNTNHLLTISYVSKNQSHRHETNRAIYGGANGMGSILPTQNKSLANDSKHKTGNKNDGEAPVCSPQHRAEHQARLLRRTRAPCPEGEGSASNRGRWVLPGNSQDTQRRHFVRGCGLTRRRVRYE